ncbi:MAG: bacteriocin family protein [Deltaproteobacteria bacterium]|nr:bacteriocin family protein [Deltaproteobacteria bacterium]
MSGPLSDGQLEHLRKEIIREARRTLVARRFLGIWGPLGAGIESVPLEQYGPDRDAEIEIIGKTDPSPIGAEGETHIRVPVLYKDFVLHWRSVELAKKMGAPLDASRAIRAAHAVADREDGLIFNGEPRFGIEGLLNASGRQKVDRGDWTKPGGAYHDVTRAQDLLLRANHHGPFVLVVPPDLYALIVRQRESWSGPEVDAIARLCEDGVFQCPAMPDGKAVLASTGDQNFDLAITEDLDITYLGDRDQDYPFRVYECVALRIKRPRALCTIE